MNKWPGISKKQTADGKEMLAMIRSMTGYGRCETADDERKITVEIKAVNNRYADFNIRMPRRINALESNIRNLL